MNEKVLFLALMGIFFISYGIWMIMNAKKLHDEDLEAHRKYLNSKYLLLRWKAHAQINLRGEGKKGVIQMRAAGILSVVAGVLALLIIVFGE